MPPSSPEPSKSGEAAAAAGKSAAFTSLCLHLENVSRGHPCPCLIHDIITLHPTISKKGELLAFTELLKSKRSLD